MEIKVLCSVNKYFFTIRPDLNTGTLKLGDGTLKQLHKKEGLLEACTSGFQHNECIVLALSIIGA